MTYNTKSWLTQLGLTAFFVIVVTIVVELIGLPYVVTILASFAIGFLLGIIFEYDRDQHYFHEKYPFASKDFPS